MGDPEAQYELGCRLRAENPYVQSDQQAFYYLEKAVDQLHPGALYLLGAVYLTGDCVNQMFLLPYGASTKHPRRDMLVLPLPVGPFFLKIIDIEISVRLNTTKFYMLETRRKECYDFTCGLNSGVDGAVEVGVELPEPLTRFVKNRKSRKNAISPECNPVEMARERFEIAANAGCDLGLKWLEKLQDQEEKNPAELLT
ncbi:hypothetical protein PHJA_001365500 [Phtheirospermum japonicum]|uniref:Uncharacterized protein n=1 Tax=Phtheirospermum japonicum TaxID=374723 RepID=A0A830C775_9LAMI|nr:hypothetical protein PHJA_001365500 [Phtheirospermum japonicum]